MLKMENFIGKLLFVLLFTNKAKSSDETTVTIFNGQVQGEIRKNELTGSEYRAFHAIPYANPPIGDLRFKPPEPFLDKWNYKYDASNSSRTPICPQIAKGNFMNIDQDQLNEDCLYLSVYAPKIDSFSSQLPVLVWIHGGSFDRGIGMFPFHGPERLIEGDDIIMVSINYRVGILGFMSLGIPDIPGNMGLHDQVMALQWVQDNIAAFGGDPNLVTIMGESAGSWSAYYHIFSPLSKGLFHRIIGQSGTPMSPAYYEYPAEIATSYGQKLAVDMGCGGWNGSANQVECLRQLSTHEIVVEHPGTYGRSMLGPKGSQAVIDGSYSEKAFLPHSTRYILTKSEYNNNVDILSGSNKDDGLEFTAQFYNNSDMLELYKNLWYNPDFNFGAQNLFILEDYKNVPDSINRQVEKATNFYLEDIKYLDLVNITHFTDMFTDSWYLFSAYDFISKHLPNKGSSNKIYQYEYSYQGENSLSVVKGYGGPYGVCHCDETFLQFHPYMNKTFELNFMDYRQSKLLISLWKNFVKTGNPSTEDVVWDPITDIDNWGYLNIETSSVMERSKDLEDRMKFWEDLLNPNSAQQQTLGSGLMNNLLITLALISYIITNAISL